MTRQSQTAESLANELNGDPVLVADWHVVARAKDLPEGKIHEGPCCSARTSIVWRHKGRGHGVEGSLHSPRLAALDGMD